MSGWRMEKFAHHGRDSNQGLKLLLVLLHRIYMRNGTQTLFLVIQLLHHLATLDCELKERFTSKLRERLLRKLGKEILLEEKKIRKKI